MNEAKNGEKIFKAAANKNRLEILRLIKSDTSLSIIGISDKLRRDFRNISQHVLKLEAAGLVAKRRDGNFVRMSLTKRGKSILEFYRILE